jgi:hypothetical protein
LAPQEASGEDTMSAIFISYRREDSQDVTDRIREHLARNYSAPEIFMDIDSIPGGVDFKQALEEAMSQCDVVLVIIGPKWTTIRNERDSIRLSDPDDFVRSEVESALQHAKVVIPLLVGGAQMPHVSELPPSMSELVNRQALPIRSGRDFSHDIGVLIETIDARRSRVAQERLEQQARTEQERLEQQARTEQERLEQLKQDELYQLGLERKRQLEKERQDQLERQRVNKVAAITVPIVAVLGAMFTVFLTINDPQITRGQPFGTMLFSGIISGLLVGGLFGYFIAWLFTPPSDKH